MKIKKVFDFELKYNIIEQFFNIFEKKICYFCGKFVDLNRVN